MPLLPYQPFISFIHVLSTPEHTTIRSYSLHTGLMMPALFNILANFLCCIGNICIIFVQLSYASLCKGRVRIIVCTLKFLLKVCFSQKTEKPSQQQIVLVTFVNLSEQLLCLIAVPCHLFIFSTAPLFFSPQ